jgi:hypothetical protein
MDYFYTPPEVLILLLNQKLFSRGTVQKNRCMVHASIIYTKTEAEKVGRGTLRWAVNLLAGIVAFGWNDGKTMHMLSTADGSDQWTTVSRQIGKDKRDVPAPNTVKSYNAYMQGIDRHYQLRVKIALAKRHGFNKWYVKMWLALIDIAFTNASICYVLENPDLKKKEGHRRRCYSAIANFLVEQGNIFDWEEQFGSKDNDVDFFQPEYDSDEEGGGFEDDAIDDQLLRELGVDRVTPATYHGAPSSVIGPLCQPVQHSSLDFGANIKRHGRIFQVCEYEERGEVQSSVNVCLAHSARLCTKTHPPVANAGLVRIDNAEPVTDYSWVCPHSEWSCWNKFHNFPSIKVYGLVGMVL